VKNSPAHFAIENFNEFKIKMLNWSSRFNIFCFLDNNKYHFDPPAFECMLAAGAARSVILNNENAFQVLKDFYDNENGWLFGHFGYHMATPDLPGNNDEIDFPGGYFFIPQVLLRLTENELTIEAPGADPLEIFQSVNEQSAVIKKSSSKNIDIKSRVSEPEYFEIIRSLKKHIQRGDCYEINFCQDFFSCNSVIDPVFLYHELVRFSPNPFSAFYKLDDKYCMCASPERFLKRSGPTLISQPIKGTSKRDLADSVADAVNKNYLLSSSKEKSENVMIVDLVRNDMSRVCVEGSVFVKELFGVYSFPQVHQMISTIQGTVDENIHWTDIIKACFPMGSMTGAPKRRVMELIGQYESSPRGLFSGSIGYVTAAGDFDFNVVIRSLFYNEKKKLISFKAGGGITFYSNAADEYRECMMKAEAIIKILEND
jgi:para-aminobenzoate synthetase component 1